MTVGGLERARVVVAYADVATAESLVRATVKDLTGADPGLLHHSCPRCGSIEHGRPYLDAPYLEAPYLDGPVEISVAHAPGLTVVAISEAGPVGIDVEAIDRLGSRGATQEWVTREAVGKAHGIGIVGDPPPGTWVTPVDIPDYVVSVALITGPATVQVVDRRRATDRTTPEVAGR